tara:strand:- start:10067 stop:10363 length:297 start_codon:yes stop_codon:yes gene_type:complete
MKNKSKLPLYPVLKVCIENIDKLDALLRKHEAEAKYTVLANCVDGKFNARDIYQVMFLTGAKLFDCADDGDFIGEHPEKGLFIIREYDILQCHIEVEV